jgi:hypothetical protein
MFDAPERFSISKHDGVCLFEASPPPEEESESRRAVVAYAVHKPAHLS